ncbi:carboxylesterase family protein [Streptomyces pinistramenti]|uniref:carboxylesterase family protein n=1 Tax=Streptomyces pinistramenti TaxID=2884812 RepID=UPI001D063176|nr:carboxylesterase family protein [Streptomyces pinistramenti]MCB5911584.1 carboxylesterase family protein [Streptomyces pinistramenti]
MAKDAPNEAAAVRRTGPIRYATAARFRPPHRTPAGSDEAASGEICPQPPSRLDAVMGAPYDVHPQGEDCLSLRITAPAAPAPPRPVLVFFHGGGFSSGSGLLDWYEGSRLSAECGLVVVSAGYRLGPLGFLRHQDVSEGNLGLLDQLEALRWVQENIARHGGDPDNVTVSGQSAGAISLALLLRHPETPRLLRRAILQSPVLELATTLPQQAAEQGTFFADALAVDPLTATFDELLGARSATAEHIAERTGSRVTPPFGPVLGVQPVPAEPPAAGLDGIDLLVGWTREELTAFGLPPEAARAAEAEAFTRPVAEFARWACAAGARLHTYRLDWAPDGSAYGATHCLELPLLLGDEAAWRGSPMLGTVPWSEVDAFGRALRATWAAFARTGQVDPAPTAGYPVRWGEGPDPLTQQALRGPVD